MKPIFLLLVILSTCCIRGESISDLLSVLSSISSSTMPKYAPSSTINTFEAMDTPQMFSDNLERGKRLIGYVQKQTTVTSLASCFKECTKMLPICVSLNMAMNHTIHTSSYNCELNSKSVDDDPEAYITDPNYIYYDVFGGT